MLCFIFGAFRTVRTIAQFGSALDWGSRGRGFKSRWSDQESPSFRRFPRHRNGGLFRIQGRSGAMYYGPPPPRPHGGESPDHTKQAPSGSVMPEGACRGRRTGHGAGKLDKNRARRPSRSGLRVDSCARAVALTPHWPLCAPEPFQPSHAARQQVGAGEFEQKRQTAVAGPDG